GLFAHKTGILPQPLPSGSSSKYLGKQMNILPDDHRVEYVTRNLCLLSSTRLLMEPSGESLLEAAGCFQTIGTHRIV
ncbi:hypothetical protein, partial [Pectobacterium sp. HCp5_1]|uniref:hypothetical protein n=1 Tax=Pectobacterium sp. HCp5_1 TaxID=3062446 RepID=UPI00293BFB6A